MKKFKNNKFQFIMSIITFIIGVYLSSGAIGLPIKAKLVILLVSFMPFILFVMFVLLINKYKEKAKVCFFINVISMIATFLLIIYYFLAIFLIAIEEADNAVTNPKYYKHYVNTFSIKRVFPKEIPKDVDNIKFYYAPGLLQAASNCSLYYIDENLSLEEFDKMYKEKAKWIGHKNEYTENECLLESAFLHTPADEYNEDDFVIYLVEGDNDDSGYCNHGIFLLAAYNEKTNEVIYRASSW